MIHEVGLGLEGGGMRGIYPARELHKRQALLQRGGAGIVQIAICDNLKEDRALLREYIYGFALTTGLEYVVEEFEHAEGLLAAIRGGKLRPDIVFMKIDTDGITGTDAAKQMLAVGFSGTTIFTTLSERHSIEGCKTTSDDYLRKPYTREAFDRNFQRAVQGCADRYKTISFPCDRLEFRVYQKDLEYVESEGRGSLLHVKGEVLKSNKTVSNFAKELSGEANFFRCHQSYLINLSFVTEVVADGIFMKNGTKVPFTLRKRAAVKKAVFDYFFLKTRGALPSHLIQQAAMCPQVRRREGPS